MYVFRQANTEQIMKEIMEMKEEFMKSWDSRDIVENWDYVKNKILQIVSDHVPIKVLKERNDLPWPTYAVKKLITRLKRTVTFRF